eukprot:14077206-Heterocapsa_arctica.AAC.1
MAKQKKEGQKVQTMKPTVIKNGFNHMAIIIENKPTKLFAILHNGEPAEMVCWLSALFRKKKVLYYFIKANERLGVLVHNKFMAIVGMEASSTSSCTTSFSA